MTGGGGVGGVGVGGIGVGVGVGGMGRKRAHDASHDDVYLVLLHFCFACNVSLHRYCVQIHLFSFVNCSSKQFVRGGGGVFMGQGGG